MIPAGYMSKKVVARPEWLEAHGVEDICSVSECISNSFADYIKFWRHNGYWLFNSAEDIAEICREHSIDDTENTLFYYEVYEKQYDEETRLWSTFEPEPSFATSVQEPAEREMVGYDVVTFSVGTSPECSPLSCNSVAAETPVNRHCLFASFEEAFRALESGTFDNSEPGPFRVFAVYRTPLAQRKRLPGAW